MQESSVARKLHELVDSDNLVADLFNPGITVEDFDVLVYGSRSFVLTLAGWVYRLCLTNVELE